MNGKEVAEEIKNPDHFALIQSIHIAQEEKRIDERKRKMIEKGELEKVELANNLLVVLESVSTQDRIDILQLALDSMLAKKRLNESQKKHVRTWTIRSKTQVGATYLVILDADGVFSCTCPDFQFRAKRCKHIGEVKRDIAGEKQKNKLPLIEGNEKYETK